MKLNKRMTAVTVVGALAAMTLSLWQANFAHADGVVCPLTVDAWNGNGPTRSSPTCNTVAINGKNGGYQDGYWDLDITDWPLTDPIYGGTLWHADAGQINQVWYEPAEGFSGIVTFPYTIYQYDNPVNTITGIVEVTVYPSIVNTTYHVSLTDDQPFLIDLSSSVAGLNLDIKCTGGQGTVSGTDITSLTYDPPADDKISTDSFTCTVQDIINDLDSRKSATLDISISRRWSVAFFNYFFDRTLPYAQAWTDNNTTIDGSDLPSDPSEPGYVFAGWFVPGKCFDPASKFDPNDPVTSHQSFVACWTANSSQASSGDSGSGALLGSQNGNDGGGYSGSGLGASSSQVRVISSTSSLTGGSGALADGQDTQLLQVTLGGNQTGSASGFSISSSPGGVQLSSVTRNSDGSFQLALTSNTPGIYQVTIRYNGVIIGTVTVNFIAGAVSIPSATVGSSQVLTGYGFMPGELVTISVHSDPIQVARLAADANGMVQATFVIPNGFALGAHTAIFAGDRSGTATAAFTVGTIVSTGGSVSSTGSAGLAGLLVMAGLAAAALIWRRRTSLAG